MISFEQGVVPTKKASLLEILCYVLKHTLRLGQTFKTIMKGELAAGEVELYFLVFVEISDSFLGAVGSIELSTVQFAPVLPSHVGVPLLTLLDAGGCDVDTNNMTNTTASLPLQQVAALPTCNIKNFAPVVINLAGFDLLHVLVYQGALDPVIEVPHVKYPTVFSLILPFLW